MNDHRPPAQPTGGSRSRMKVRVARDQHFEDQIGHHQWFDLMNPEKVLSNITLLCASACVPVTLQVTIPCHVNQSLHS